MIEVSSSLVLRGAVVAAVAALFVLNMQGDPGVDTSTWDFAPGLREKMICADLCFRGPSKQDQQFAENFKQRHPDQNIDLSQLCIWRCVEGEKSQDELEHPEMSAHDQPPPRIKEYASTAQECSRFGTGDTSENTTPESAGARLSKCGVTHLHLLESSETADKISKAMFKLKNKGKLKDYTELKHIRAGREEIWLPFEPPLGDLVKRLAELVSPYLQHYMPNAVFDHVSVIVAPPGVESQGLHADFSKSGKHLEVHVPLVDITAGLGPTVFCPGTHGGLDGSADAADRAIEWYFLDEKNCGTMTGFSYVRLAPAGAITIYDANVYHGGSANNGTVPRPVLQLSFGASLHDIDARNYLRSVFKDDPKRRLGVLEAVSAYRKALG